MLKVIPLILGIIGGRDKESSASEDVVPVSNIEIS
jgi:hypothetical protein